MKYIANAISILSNPFLLLIPAPFLLVYRVSHDSAYAFYWALISLIFFGFIGMFILYEVKKGTFSDVDVSRREQRPFLFLAIGIAVVMYLLILIILNGPVILYLAAFGFILGIFFITVINRKIKASIHVATITALLLIFGFLYGVQPIFFLLIPVIGWSRVVIKRHTVSEVIVGSIIGGGLTLLMYGVVKIAFQVNL